MPTLEFDYDDWENKDDILLHRPGNQLGFTAIICSLEVGDMSTVRKRKDDELIRETEDGVVGLIAGGIEWLRKRGYSVAEVQSKVRAYKQDNLDRIDQTAIKEASEQMEEISNPADKTLSDKVVIG